MRQRNLVGAAYNIRSRFLLPLMKPRIRPKVRKAPEAPAGELFPLPETITPSVATTRPVPPAKKITSAKKKSTKGTASDQQPFLPGLARRGRPPLQNPLPASTRAANSRKKRIEGGAKRIELMLQPEVANALDVLAEHYKESRAESVSRLVLKATKRIRQ